MIIRFYSFHFAFAANEGEEIHAIYLEGCYRNIPAV